MKRILLLRGIWAAAAVTVTGGMAWGQTTLDSFLGGTSKYQNVKVEEVLNADTFVLEDGEMIRLIGLQAPEGPRRRKKLERDEHGFVVEEEADPAGSVEDQSFLFARELTEGKMVRLEFDVERKDARYRTLAYVFLVKDGTLVNAEILRQGFADLHLQPPNMKYAQQLRAAYNEARDQQRGLQGK